MNPSALFDSIPSGKRALVIMTPQDGDLRVTWDANTDDEVDAARSAFNEQKRKGMAAFRVDRKGKKAEPMREFDPDAEAVVMTPPVRGG